jgi:RNA polymerase sigma-70 factor (ECF subfamily)
MTDNEILELFHSDKREKAFKLVMEKYQQRLYWHIRRMVKNNHENADDILQNTFIKVWNGLENFRNESQLYSWLYRIATNEALNFLNKEKRHLHISFEGGFGNEDDDENYAPQNYVKGESNPIDAEDIEARLAKAIESLPEKQRIVFNLRYYDEMPYEEMSEVLQTSVGALKASYHHAAKKVEDFLLSEKK